MGIFCLFDILFEGNAIAFFWSHFCGKILDWYLSNCFVMTEIFQIRVQTRKNQLFRYFTQVLLCQKQNEDITDILDISTKYPSRQKWK